MQPKREEINKKVSFIDKVLKDISDGSPSPEYEEAISVCESLIEERLLSCFQSYKKLNLDQKEILINEHYIKFQNKNIVSFILTKVALKLIYKDESF